MNTPDFNTRSAVVLLMLLAAMFAVYRRSDCELVPVRPDLQSFPTSIAHWSTSTDQPIDPDVRSVLGSGDFLNRLYTATHDPPIDLFVAYLPSQRSGSTLHSPKNCLPGSGWTPLDTGVMTLEQPNRTIRTNRYVVGRGSERLVVLYWYQAHGRTIASEYEAKYFLMRDSIRLNRTDGALIRITTPVIADETVGSAERRAAEFARTMAPLLETYIPR